MKTSLLMFLSVIDFFFLSFQKHANLDLIMMKMRINANFVKGIFTSLQKARTTVSHVVNSSRQLEMVPKVLVIAKVKFNFFNVLKEECMNEIHTIRRFRQDKSTISSSGASLFVCTLMMTLIFKRGMINIIVLIKSVCQRCE